MRAEIAQSRWVLVVHCVRSVSNVLSRKSERIGCLESQLSQQTIASLSPWTGCVKKGEGCGERKIKKKKECDRSF